MMPDADFVAASPSTVLHVLNEIGNLELFHGKASEKSTGFVKPLSANECCRVDVSNFNTCRTFYFMDRILGDFIRVTPLWTIDNAPAEMSEYENFHPSEVTSFRIVGNHGRCPRNRPANVHILRTSIY